MPRMKNIAWIQICVGLTSPGTKKAQECLHLLNFVSAIQTASLRGAVRALPSQSGKQWRTM